MASETKQEEKSPQYITTKPRDASRKYDYIVACLGAGYVGGPTMAMIALKCPKIKVIVADINPAQIERWNSDKLPIYEPGLDDIILAVRGRNLFFTSDVTQAIVDAEMIFVSVNTPTKKYGVGAGKAADLKNWELAARHIARVATSAKIVIEKSTLPVRTAHSMQRVLAANSNSSTQAKGGASFVVLSNPEFLAEGTAIADLSQPDRVLIGGGAAGGGSAAEQAAVSRLVWLYAHWVPAERILTTNLWSAELSKLVANAFLAQRVSSINSISALCEASGAAVSEVAAAIGMDARIGPRFLQSSVGFGGSCFQKDILNLVYICESLGLAEVAAYWAQVISINDWQKRRFAKLVVQRLFNTIAGKRIALLGFAFKKNTGDTRETPAVYVAKHLLSERAHLAIFDPQVQSAQIRSDFASDDYAALPEGKHFDECVEICGSAMEAAKGAHAVLILTEWDELRDTELDYQAMYESMLKPAFVFDGRNILDLDKLKKIGFNVYGIGKPVQGHVEMDNAETVI